MGYKLPKTVYYEKNRMMARQKRVNNYFKYHDAELISPRGQVHENDSLKMKPWNPLFLMQLAGCFSASPVTTNQS